MYTNDTVGGLLNASFGNATEVIISGGCVAPGAKPPPNQCLPGPTPSGQGMGTHDTKGTHVPVSLSLHITGAGVSACRTKPSTWCRASEPLAEQHAGWSERLRCRPRLCLDASVTATGRSARAAQGFPFFPEGSHMFHAHGKQHVPRPTQTQQPRNGPSCHPRPPIPSSDPRLPRPPMPPQSRTHTQACVQ